MSGERESENDSNDVEVVCAKISRQYNTGLDYDPGLLELQPVVPMGYGIGHSEYTAAIVYNLLDLSTSHAACRPYKDEPMIPFIEFCSHFLQPKLRSANGKYLSLVVIYIYI
ncbi:hypothetical protein CAAN1_16S01904 [[Candida] anglica]|uniref:Uncharacterized protein n=1 Tax=[Candida] anglica TaxID=148631 RepID=A0ABP0EA78_9ASCO